MSQEEEEELVFRERAEAAPKLDLEQCIFSGTRHKDFGGALSHMARQVRGAAPRSAPRSANSAYARVRSTASSSPTWSTWPTPRAS